MQSVRFQTVANFDWFPEGPSYRSTDTSYFFSGSNALTRVDAERQLHVVLGKPGGGGTHFLPDGSVLNIGHIGLRRLYPDGRIKLLADGKEIGAGNDRTVGIPDEIYFRVPEASIYRLTAKKKGATSKSCRSGMQWVGS